MRYLSTLLIASAASIAGGAQVLTREDSLQAGLVSSDRATVVSGYGEAKVTYDLREKTGEANLSRAVLFVGHRFSDRVSLFTEFEVEDAKVEGGEPGGEAAMEQAFVKFNITRDIYINAGLVIPRLGIINENHLPTTFNSNYRPMVETVIIPSTWRELGFAVYGQTPKIPGFNWSIGLFNGLNSAEFGGGMGIREGRFEGREASASNLAVSGALLYYHNALRFQVSGYYGGTVGLSHAEADTLGLQSGPFGTPVALGEADVQYFGRGLTLKALGTVVSIPDAKAINDAYGNNAPSMMWGAYAEAGFNVLSLNPESKRSLTFFGRYEILDANAQVPENGIRDEYLAQQYIIGGVTWMPVHGVAVKADYMQRITGDPNPALQINPISGGTFYASKGFISLGIAYSF